MSFPTLTYPSVNWKDGMKLTEQHFVAHDNHLHDLIRDTAWSSLNAYNYGLLPATSANSLQVNLFGDEVVVSVCKALTADGCRIHLTEEHTALKRSILDIPADGYGRRDGEYFITVTVDPFHPVSTGEPDPKQSPVRFPFVMPRLGLAFFKKSELQNAAHSQAQLAIGKLRIEANTCQLDAQYIPPCTRLKAHAELMAFHTKQGADLGRVIEKAILVLKNAQKQDSPTHAKDLVVANSIATITESLLMTLATSYDRYLHLLPELPPLEFVLFFKEVARSMNYCFRSLPDGDREQVFNYIRTNATKDMDYAYYSHTIEQVLNVHYHHNDLRTAFVPIEYFVRDLLVLFDRMVDLGFLKTSTNTSSGPLWQKLR